jgi:hypothetical protein
MTDGQKETKKDANKQTQKGGMEIDRYRGINRVTKRGKPKETNRVRNKHNQTQIIKIMRT